MIINTEEYGKIAVDYDKVHIRGEELDLLYGTVFIYKGMIHRIVIQNYIPKIYKLEQVEVK